jgi:hypothetical protein
MDTHENAPMTPKGREVMVRFVIDSRQSKAAADPSLRSPMELRPC